MTIPTFRNLTLLLAFLAATCSSFAQTNPAITSWVINTTGLTGYNCSGCTPPVYGTIPANVQSVYYDATYAYISATSIPSYNIGPWTANPNTPTNQNKIFRIKLNPTNNSTHTTTPLGNIGIWANGIGVFNAKDGMSYNNAGVWNRNAYYYEGVSFDACLGHPAPGGNYHNHVNPSCLYNSNASTHSPILGYAFDGYPIYGPYAYTNTNGTGAIKRMKSSYTLSSNTTRTNGPAVSATYPAGCFCEDYAYTAGSGDLDQYNGRFSVTPEYPSGTYAYFVTIESSGIPAYPFVVGPTYYGTYSATNTVASIPSGAVQYTPTFPVELSDFSAKAVGDENHLFWTTFSESQNKGFEVEYSVDGANFELLGFMPTSAKDGNSSEALSYRFIDPSPAADLVFYRLRQIDVNGTYRNSQIIRVKRKSSALDVRLFPNPVIDNIVTLQIDDTSQDLYVEILNAQGRVLINRRFQAGEYDQEVQVEAPHLGAGMYWIGIEMGGNRVLKTVLFDVE